jgi:hypothetical protein
LNKYHLHNFNIYLQQMPDGRWYEVAYYEYTGEDFEADTAALDAEPRNIECRRHPSITLAITTSAKLLGSGTGAMLALPASRLSRHTV